MFKWKKRPEHWLRIREKHYAKFLGPMDDQIMHSMDIKDVHVDIYRFPPHGDRHHWTLITGGMSDVPQNIPKELDGISPRAEIMMYVREPKGWMYSVLKGLAEMPFDGRTFLHWHHTVQNGMPMTAEPSELTAFFFLPPYFEGAKFDTLKIAGDDVDILWLIPITERERVYAVENGSQALEEVFVENEMDPVVDEGRASLVP